MSKVGDELGKGSKALDDFVSKASKIPAPPSSSQSSNTLLPSSIPEPRNRSRVAAFTFGMSAPSAAQTVVIQPIIAGPVYGFDDFAAKVNKAVKQAGINGGFRGVFAPAGGNI
jgi:hypothetical protein